MMEDKIALSNKMSSVNARRDQIRKPSRGTDADANREKNK